MIHWIEARHKATGQMIKHSDFDRITCITSDDPDYAHTFLAYLASLRDMATGVRRHTFLDVISRTFVETSEGRLLWYCKTEEGPQRLDASHSKTRLVTEAWIDEEEIYAGDESLVLSRNLKGAQMMEDQSFISLNPSASTVSALGHKDARALYDVFSKILIYKIPEEGPQALSQEWDKVTDDHIVILDGLGAKEAWLIDDLITKLPEKTQVLAFGCRSSFAPNRKIIEGRKSILLAKTP